MYSIRPKASIFLFCFLFFFFAVFSVFLGQILHFTVHKDMTDAAKHASSSSPSSPAAADAAANKPSFSASLFPKWYGNTSGRVPEIHSALESEATVSLCPNTVSEIHTLHKEFISLLVFEAKKS